jgi:hypothetical protein
LRQGRFIGGIMIKSIKTLKNVLAVLLVVSLSFNFYQYHQNKNLKQSIGFDYQGTVRNTLFDLDTPTSFWLEELKKENGDVLLERHIGDLLADASDFNRMGGTFRMLREQLHYISDLYWDLDKAIKQNIEFEIVTLHKKIEDHRNLILTILKETENNLGTNNILWFKQLSNPESEASNFLLDEFNAYEGFILQ